MAESSLSAWVESKGWWQVPWVELEEALQDRTAEAEGRPAEASCCR